MGKLANDLKCLLVQRQVYKKVYGGRKVNDFEPWNPSETRKLENGIVRINDLKYGSNYPNSYLDIWYPDDSGKKRPVFVYFHGGGFIFGDKTTGDPLAANGSSPDKLQGIIQAGYILVNANYALAPKYRFPVQLHQVNEVFAFLLEKAEELHLDMEHVCLSGGSAGADMTQIYATAICNPDYAKLIGVKPVMTEQNLKVLAIDEAALDPTYFNGAMYAMLGCWVQAKKNSPSDPAVKKMIATDYMTDHFIPSWINASSENGDNNDFIVSARRLEKKMKEIGCDYDLVYFPGTNYPHGYMDNLKTNADAKEAFDRMMAFVGEHI